MMMLSAAQIHTARVSLGWSLAKLASMAGVSTNSVFAVERGSDCRMSTMRALAEAMATEGILFFSDNSVGQRMSWADGKPSDPRVADAALQILNSARKRDGKCNFVDE